MMAFSTLFSLLSTLTLHIPAALSTSPLPAPVIISRITLEYIHLPWFVCHFYDNIFEHKKRNSPTMSVGTKNSAQID